MNKRRAGTIASYLYSLAQVVVSLVYVPLLLSGIGRSEYGLYQTVGSVIAYFSVISSVFSAGATRFYCKYYVLGDEDGMANVLGILRRIYRIAYLVIAVAAAACMIVVSEVYRESFSPWEVRESCLMLVVLAINLAVTLNNTIAMASITAHEEFVFIKVSSLLTLVAQPVLVVALIRRFPYALTVSLVQLACNFLCCAIQNVYARRKLGMDTKLRFLDRRLEKEIASFSGTIVLATIADQIFWKSDQLILGYLYGTGVVAVYAVGSQVVNAYSPLAYAVSSVFMPKVSELWHRDHDLGALSSLFLRVSRLTLYPLLAVLLGFIVFGQDFIRLWAGDGYAEAYWVTVLELVPFTIDLSQTIGLTILQVMDRYGFRARMYFVAALINIGLTIVLAQRMGIVGAALASGIAMVVSSGFVLNWYYQVRIGMDMAGWWKSVVREIVPMIALCVAAHLAWEPVAGGGWLELILGVLVWAVAFTLVSYLVSANAYERDLVRSLLRRAR